jgi:ferrous iron transport protein B
MLLGTENAGKTALAAGLAGGMPTASNVAGSTVAVERVTLADRDLLDTPGITSGADAGELTSALEGGAEVTDVALVVTATRIDDDLAALLPLVGRHRTAIVVTNRDRVDPERSTGALELLRRRLGVPVVAVDARHVGAAERDDVLAALTAARPLPHPLPRVRVGWKVEPPVGALDHRLLGPVLGLVLLLAPAVLAVAASLALAGALEAPLTSVLLPLEAAASSLPTALRDVLIGPYGLLAMGPLLILWAAPVVLAFAVLGGVGKASGALDRLGGAIEPVVRWSGLAGRDLVRVVLGFGCNVPAVTATRACALCSRRAVIAAIAFGSACSYQLGATLSVFAAADRPELVVPYLGWLGVMTLLHARVFAGRAPGDGLARLEVIHHRTFVVRPTMQAVWREASMTLQAFVRTALPIFALVCLAASLLDTAGVLGRLAEAIAEPLSLLGLPVEASPGLLAATVRKDGILLLAEPGALAAMSGGQLLAATYLASVLTPCLVTALTIAREQGWGVAGGLLVRQAGVALASTALLLQLTAAIGRG